jgi:GNAT superfamily N-acetyltransferase
MAARLSGEVQIRPGAARDVPALEPLWVAMHAHHSAMPKVPPTRPVDVSWQLRRRQYEEWLSTGAGRLLIAEDDAEPVGYAMVRLEPGSPTWDVGEQVAELESLSVAPQARGERIGARLIEAARAVARESGAGRLLVAVAHANEGALRFYAREGFAPFYVLLMQPADSPPPAPG